MLVHNYYNDMMSTLYQFLNGYVLSSNNTARSIHYNLEDASAALEYVDFSKLPSMVIGYDAIDEDAKLPTHPRMFQFTRDLTGISVDQVSAVSNYTKGLEFFVQMRPFTLNVNVTIKCSAQLQALNIKHELLDSLPVGKLLNHPHMEFVSFFDLDNRFLIPSVNDVVNDNISNLFLYEDGFGTISKMFPLQFNPMIRMNSSPSVTLDDKTAGSYITSFSLELSIYEPFKFLTNDQQLNHDMFTGISTSTLPIVKGPVEVPIYTSFIHILIGSKTYSFDPNLLPYTDTDGTVISGIFTGEGTKFEYDSGSGLMFKYANGLTLIRLNDGRTISGGVLDILNRTITGLLSDGTPITLNLLWFETTPTVTNLRVVPVNDIIRLLPTNDIYSVATNIPPFRTILNLNTSAITTVKVIHNTTKVVSSEAITIAFLPNGDFTAGLTTGGTLFGHINKTTCQFERIKLTDTNYSIFSITLLPNFDFQAYGSNIIESIALDTTGTKTSVMSLSNTYNSLIGGVVDYNINFLTVLTSITSTPVTSTTSAYKFEFVVTIDPTNLVLDLTEPLKFKPSFSFNGQFVDGYILMVDQSTPLFLTFQVTDYFKATIIDKISTTNPLYFGITII